MNPPEPIHVFISSDEDEFSELRARLQTTLESVRIVNMTKVGEQERGQPDERYLQQLFHPEIVEYTRGGDIDKKIADAMKRSQLYVGLFGKEFSERTKREFLDAVNRGMTTLVYYALPSHTLKELRGSSSKVYDFMMNEVKPKTLIRGNYQRKLIKTLDELEDEIVVDLLAELTDMVRQYHGVQKAVKGFQY